MSKVNAGRTQQKSGLNVIFGQVKQFCRIFILYFIALILMPCTDVHAANPTVLNSAPSTEHNSCPHEKETDFCSPFCICSCCGQIVITAPERAEMQRANQSMVQTKLMPPEQLSFQSEYLDRLFHPPRL